MYYVRRRFAAARQNLTARAVLILLILVLILVVLLILVLVFFLVLHDAPQIIILISAGDYKIIICKKIRSYYKSIYFSSTASLIRERETAKTVANAPESSISMIQDRSESKLSEQNIQTRSTQAPPTNNATISDARRVRRSLVCICLARSTGSIEG